MKKELCVKLVIYKEHTEICKITAHITKNTRCIAKSHLAHGQYYLFAYCHAVHALLYQPKGTPDTKLKQYF